MRYFLGILFWSVVFSLNAQLSIKFSCEIESKPIELNRFYQFKNGKDSFSIEVLKFYISDIQLYQDSSLSYPFPKKYYLIDLESGMNLNFITEDIKQFNCIKFNLGIDSLTNSEGVKSDDLDPMNGMYWTWHSGYINLKLEGKSNRCLTRKNQFQYHLGGFLDSSLALQKLEFKILNKSQISIHFPIDEILYKLDLRSNPEIMSPQGRAVDISKIIAKSIYVD